MINMIENSLEVVIHTLKHNALIYIEMFQDGSPTFEKCDYKNHSF